MGRGRWVAACVVAFAGNAHAAPYIVKDVRPGAAGSSPSRIAALGNDILFFADDGVNGNELWKSDGTPAGTAIVKDLNAGAASGSTLQFANVSPVLMGGALYFSAFAPSTSLVKSDGTTGGTIVLANNIVATSLAVSGTTLFFYGSTPAAGVELWKSDGTIGGTAMVKDVNPGASSAVIGVTPPPAVMGTSVYFVANDATIGAELWKSDGTDAGTVLVKDVYPGPTSSNISELIAATGTLYFVADDGVNGRSIWKSDGTSGGTVRVASAPGASVGFFAVGARAYFQSIAGQTLWVTDGTALGTVQLAGGRADNPTAFGSNVFFYGFDVNHGSELWKTDGTVAGTAIVKDLAPAGISSRPFGPGTPVCPPRAVGALLYFCADDGTSGLEAWHTDGTAATFAIEEVSSHGNAEPTQFTAAGGRVFFGADDGVNGRELWATGGAPSGVDAGTPPASGAQPYAIRDVRPGPVSSFPQGFADLGAKLLFFADDGTHGQEPWISDGTTLGTNMIADVVPGANGSIATPRAVVMGGKAYYVGLQTSQNALYATDGTAAGTAVVQKFITLSSLTPNGTTLFFYANDFVTAGNELWKSDGTAAGTTVVKDIVPGSGSGIDDFERMIVTSGTKTYFIAKTPAEGRELWVTDGTSGGTFMLKDIAVGASDGVPSTVTSFADVAGTLFFGATDGQLWKTDGTTNGTVKVTTTLTSGVTNLVSYGGKIYFQSGDATGSGLFASDGTTTALVKAMTLGAPFVVANNLLFFFGNEAAHGWELWKTDGVTTEIVKDIRPGGESSVFSPYASGCSVRAVGNTIVFCADDGVHGFEFWQSDGSAAGTVPIEISAHGNAIPFDVLAVGTKTFFSAIGSPDGIELWGLGAGGPGSDGGTSSSSSSSSSSSGSNGAASGGTSSGASGTAPTHGTPEDDSGCGCRTTNDATSLGGATLAGVALAWLLRSRRRQRQ
jgi:MYXO-CTERM domain-containing protein